MGSDPLALPSLPEPEVSDGDLSDFLGDILADDTSLSKGGDFIFSLVAPHMETEALHQLHIESGNTESFLKPMADARQAFCKAREIIGVGNDSYYEKEIYAICDKQADAGLFNDAREVLDGLINASNNFYGVTLKRFLHIANAQFNSGAVTEARETLASAFLYLTNPNLGNHHMAEMEAIDGAHVVAFTQAKLGFLADARQTVSQAQRMNNNTAPYALSKITRHAQIAYVCHKLGRHDLRDQSIANMQIYVNNARRHFDGHVEDFGGPVTDPLRESASILFECGLVDGARNILLSAVALEQYLVDENEGAYPDGPDNFISTAEKQAELGFLDDAKTTFNRARAAVAPLATEAAHALGQLDELFDFEPAMLSFSWKAESYIKISIAERKCGFNERAAETLGLARGIVSDAEYLSLYNKEYVSEWEKALDCGSKVHATEFSNLVEDSTVTAHSPFSLALLRARTESGEQSKARMFNDLQEIINGPTETGSIDINSDISDQLTAATKLAKLAHAQAKALMNEQALENLQKAEALSSSFTLIPDRLPNGGIAHDVWEVNIPRKEAFKNISTAYTQLGLSYITKFRE